MSNVEGRKSEPGDAFARRAEARAPGLLVELVDFLRHNRKWWLAPLLILLLLSAGLLILGSLPGASILYTFF